MRQNSPSDVIVPRVHEHRPSRPHVIEAGHVILGLHVDSTPMLVESVNQL